MHQGCFHHRRLGEVFSAALACPDTRTALIYGSLTTYWRQKPAWWEVWKNCAIYNLFSSFFFRFAWGSPVYSIFLFPGSSLNFTARLFHLDQSLPVERLSSIFTYFLPFFSTNYDFFTLKYFSLKTRARFIGAQPLHLQRTIARRASLGLMLCNDRLAVLHFVFELVFCK